MKLITAFFDWLIPNVCFVLFVAAEGLSGMKEVSPSPAEAKIHLIRPLLHETRAALETFAKAHKIKFREDASNQSLDFQRNRIRRELLPRLRRYQPALTSTVLRSVELVAAEADFVGEHAARFLEQGKPAFEQLHVAVQRRVLLLQLRRFGLAADFDLVEKLRLQRGTPIVPGPGTQVLRDASGIVHVRKIETAGPDLREMEIGISKSGEAVYGGVRLHWIIEKRTGTGRVPARNCEFFDANKVGTKAVLRTWRPGDRFQPIGIASPPATAASDGFQHHFNRCCVLLSSLNVSEILSPWTQNTAPDSLTATTRRRRSAGGTFALVKRSCNFTGDAIPIG